MAIDTATERGKSVPRTEQLPTVVLNPDEQFFVDHKCALLEGYEGRFIAIRRCEIVADADTRRELEEVLLRKYNEPVYAMVRRVTEDAFKFGAEDPILIA